MYPQLLPDREDGHLRTMGVAVSLWGDWVRHREYHRRSNTRTDPPLQARMKV